MSASKTIKVYLLIVFIQFYFPFSRGYATPLLCQQILSPSKFIDIAKPTDLVTADFFDQIKNITLAVQEFKLMHSRDFDLLEDPQFKQCLEMISQGNIEQVNPSILRKYRKRLDLIVNKSAAVERSLAAEKYLQHCQQCQQDEMDFLESNDPSTWFAKRQSFSQRYLQGTFSFANPTRIRFSSVENLIDDLQKEPVEQRVPVLKFNISEIPLLSWVEVMQIISRFKLDSQQQQAWNLLRPKLFDRAANYTPAQQTVLTAYLSVDMQLIALGKKDEKIDIKKSISVQAQSVKLDGTQAVFVNIKAPGKIYVGQRRGLFRRRTSVTLTNDLHINAFPTTQILYATIAELANKYLNLQRPINPDPSKFKGKTRPIEMVSHEDGERWEQALNDLVALNNPEVTAQILKVIPDHEPGRIYTAFATTEVEFEYLMQTARTQEGQTLDELIKNNDLARLHQYAVFGLKAENGSTEPVTSKLPLHIDKQAIYGLGGNVWEWQKDKWDGNSPILSGANPMGLNGQYYSLRGGSCFSVANWLRSTYRYGWEPAKSDVNVGFRLGWTSQ